MRPARPAARAGRGGLALTFVTQYDVKLIQAVEDFIGEKLTKGEMDEDPVELCECTAY